MEPGWNEAEEKAISEMMADECGRIEAIRRLRSSWRIGETAPPMWSQGRTMPKENPRYGTAALSKSMECQGSVIGTDLCAGCGKLFSPSRPNNRTCSDRCRKLASRRARMEQAKTPREATSQPRESVTKSFEGFGAQSA